MAIEIVDRPIKNCDFPWQNVSSPEGKMVHQVIYFSRFNKPWRLDVAIIIFGHLSSILEDEKMHSKLLTQVKQNLLRN